MKLSSNEITALESLVNSNGCISINRIGNTNSIDIFGNVIPGMNVFKKLEKKGLIFFTEEEPIPDLEGFMFTEDVYITDEGIKILKENIL